MPGAISRVPLRSGNPRQMAVGAHILSWQNQEQLRWDLKGKLRWCTLAQGIRGSGEKCYVTPNHLFSSASLWETAPFPPWPTVFKWLSVCVQFHEWHMWPQLAKNQQPILGLLLEWLQKSSSFHRSCWEDKRLNLDQPGTMLHLTSLLQQITSPGFSWVFSHLVKTTFPSMHSMRWSHVTILN